MQIKGLSEVARDLRALADSLELVEVVEEEGKEEGNIKEIELIKEGVTGKEEVRAQLAKKSQAGFIDEIRSIINRYGCNKLSEVDPKYYADILKASEGLN